MATDNETMVIEDGVELKPQEDRGPAANNQGKTPWKRVAIGTTSGILLGAGASYAVNSFAANDDSTNANTTKPHKMEEVKVAKVNEEQSFDDAFASARAQVGAGGVFHWHGGTYGTYTENEWNAMSKQDKVDFANAAQPEIRANAIANERIAESHYAVRPETVANEHSHASDTAATNVHQNIVHKESTDQDSEDNDVHIVGYGRIQGHQAVALDINDNGEADVAIIDWNDNGRLDDPDVMIDREGNYATIGQLAQAQEDHDSNTDNSFASNDDYSQDPNIRTSSYEDNTGNEAIDSSFPEDSNDATQDDGSYVNL